VNEEETAVLLTSAAAFDRRTIGEADVIAWAKLLRDYRFEDAQEALEAHYASSREWVMPYDIIEGIKTIRAKRRAAYVREHGVLLMPQGLEPEEELRVRRDWERQVGDGAQGPWMVERSLTDGRRAHLIIEGGEDA